MQTTRNTVPGITDYYTVDVGPSDVFPGGKRLRFSCCIGTIEAVAPHKVTVWTPAASVFRGYRAAAMAMLEAERAKIAGGAA